MRDGVAELACRESSRKEPIFSQRVLFLFNADNRRCRELSLRVIPPGAVYCIFFPYVEGSVPDGVCRVVWV